MSLIPKMLRVYFPMLVFTFLFALPSTNLNANEIEFQERASEIILNSLEMEPKKSFLRKAYKELLFSPVWMRERSLSKAAKELFTYIAKDETLNTQGKTLYRCACTQTNGRRGVYKRRQYL